MLSHYTWGQFGLFILVLVVLYYLVVGFIYYRDELGALLTPGKKRAGAPAGVAARPNSPSLVRPTSAFANSQLDLPAEAATTVNDSHQPEEGAAQNLPTPTELLVGGELPSSTAAATGPDQNLESSGNTAETATDAATLEAIEQDAERTEYEDKADAQLAAIIRQRMQETATEKITTDKVRVADLEAAEVAYEASDLTPTEPIADFTEPIASTLDIKPALQEQLLPADEVVDYVVQVQAGVAEPRSSIMKGLDDTALREQLLLRTAENVRELTIALGKEA